MNTSPMLHGRQLHTSGYTVTTCCGRQAEVNRALSFWQSRMTRPGQRAEPLELVDLCALAHEVRVTWPRF